MSIKHELQADVDQHGEVHATIEEHDAELEIRRGQVHWDTPSERCFTLRSHGELHTFQYDRVVNWYTPQDIWH